MSLRLLFAGGGSGGHLIPALVVAEAVHRRQPDAEIRFVATTRSVDSRLLPRAGFPYDLISLLSLKREIHFDLIRFPIVNLAGFVRSMGIVAGFRPHLVFSTGGFAGGPAGLAAYLMGVPIALLEPNVYPGLTIRLLSRGAAQVHLAYGEAGRRVGGRRKPISGIPLRAAPSTLTVAEARSHFGLSVDRQTVLVTGGSQGALGINLAVGEALPELVRADIQVLWQAGTGGVQAAEMSAKSWPEQVRVVAFVDEMPTAYRAADLAITRAGATTLAEQSLYGVPAILIPLPTSAENHQEFNARTVERRGAAAMVLQRELSGSRLARQVISLLKDSDRLGEMQKRAFESAVPDAADRIVDAMTEEGLLRGDAG